MSSHRKGYVKSEQPGRGMEKDTYTPESGAQLVAKVMAKAESSHDKGGEAQNWRLGTNVAKHVSGSDDFGGFGNR